jgi:hypothetical protein
MIAGYRVTVIEGSLSYPIKASDPFGVDITIGNCLMNIRDHNKESIDIIHSNLRSFNSYSNPNSESSESTIENV